MCCYRTNEFGRHSHHSNNAHLIIRGSLIIWTSPDHLDARTWESGCRVDAIRGQAYAARVSDLEGCSFVEGHQAPNPTTWVRTEMHHTANAIHLNIILDGICSVGANTTSAMDPVNCRCWCNSGCKTTGGCSCIDGETGDDEKTEDAGETDDAGESDDDEESDDEEETCDDEDGDSGEETDGEETDGEETDDEEEAY
jgi:hypothetical protein